MKNQSMKQKLKKKKDLTTTDEDKEEIDLDYQNVIAEIQKDGESLIENSSQSVENHAEIEKTVEEFASWNDDTLSENSTSSEDEHWDQNVQQTVSSEEQREHELKIKRMVEKIIMDANYFKSIGNFEEYEKKIIEGLATVDANNLELNKMLADFYFTNGNYQKALSLLKKITERDPRDHKSIWQIGEIYFINGDNETAELLVEKAINLRPDSPKYNLSLVEIYYNTNRINEAIACMEKIIRLRPTNTNYMLTIAELYEEVKDFQNAKKYYFNVLEYEPTNDKAKKKIKELSEN